MVSHLILLSPLGLIMHPHARPHALLDLDLPARVAAPVRRDGRALYGTLVQRVGLGRDGGAG